MHNMTYTDIYAPKTRIYPPHVYINIRYSANVSNIKETRNNMCTFIILNTYNQMPKKHAEWALHVVYCLIPFAEKRTQAQHQETQRRIPERALDERHPPPTSHPADHGRAFRARSHHKWHNFKVRTNHRE